MKGVVLVVDNDKAFRETCVALLNGMGYETCEASSFEEAHRVRERVSVDLAVIDVRLEDDDDPDNRSGITLAKDEKFRDIPKIILTAYPVSHENASEVLGMPLHGLPVALHIFTKPDVTRMVESIPEFLSIWHRWHRLARDNIFIEASSILTPDQRHRLVDLIVRLPVAADFDSRSSLLNGIPGASQFNRTSTSARVDIDNLLEQLNLIGRLSTGQWPLLLFLDNVVTFLASEYEIRNRINEIIEEIWPNHNKI